MSGAVDFLKAVSKRQYHQCPDYSRSVYLLEIDEEKFAETASPSSIEAWDKAKPFLSAFEDEVVKMARIVEIRLAERQ